MNDKPYKKITGALFEGQNPNGPAFSGFFEVHEDIPAGTKLYVACWPRTSKNGAPYLGVDEDKLKAQKAAGQGPGQVSFRPGTTYGGHKPKTFSPKPNPNISTGPQQVRTSRPDMDDDIPFAPEFR
jgi:hypothetical protein